LRRFTLRYTNSKTAGCFTVTKTRFFI